MIDDRERLLTDNVRRFLAERYRFEDRRKLVESELGFSRENWELMAELGWLALPFEEAFGGIGGTLRDLAVVMESFGRALVVEPYLSTIVVGGGLIAAAGTERHKRALLTEIVEGRLLVAFAHFEPAASFERFRVETRARETENGYRLHGRKAIVKGAPAADRLIVSARIEREDPRSPHPDLGLFLVDRGARGVTLQSYATVDGLRAAEVDFDGVDVPREDLLGEPGLAEEAIETVGLRTVVALGAEAAGAMDSLVEATRGYLVTRRQFGVPLASFQALQHRLVDMYVDAQLSRALVFRAATILDSEERNEARRSASMVKAQIGIAGKRIGKEAIQLHGGMGMTDDLPVGHHFKRLTAIDLELGTADEHLGRLARSYSGRAVDA